MSSLALSRSADRNRPCRYCTSTTRPSAGMRWTCTSSTDRKTLTRGAGTRGRSSSGGGTTSETSATVPSAADSTTPVRDGGTRCGLRKKAAVAAVTSPPTSAPRPVTSRARPAATATAATIGRPPGCIGGTASRTSAATCASEVDGTWLSGAVAGCPVAGRSGAGTSRLTATGGGIGGSSWLPTRSELGRPGRAARAATYGTPVASGGCGTRPALRPGKREGPGPPSPETATPARNRSSAPQRRAVGPSRAGRLPGPLDKYPRACDESSRSPAEDPCDVPDRPNAQC